ncbi:group II intron reverse transcriptase/maturase (plasmid) [Rhodococcus sp. WB1]|nr:group II intron reverse transcriptase/maturase [Rhodococcus sp. WB1]
MNIGAWEGTPAEAADRVVGIQTKLHRWAVADLGRRFDDVFNLVTDPAFMLTAWMRVRNNTGARSAGIDGRTTSVVEALPGGVEEFLADLRERVRSGQFAPVPVRRAMIPKAGGKLRALGIPTVADRVVQAALKLVLEPIFEAGFSSSSYGFRPGRRAHDAIEDIRMHAHNGYVRVFEGDIHACFDEISHSALLGRVRSRIKDKRIVALVRAFLKAGVLTEGGFVRDTPAGTPQGGILSPLLANIALSVLDEHFDAKRAAQGTTASARSWRRKQGEGSYRLVRYADDFVVLVHGTDSHLHALREEVETVLSTMGLRLSLAKTHAVHIDQGFDFLGFRIQRHTQWGSDRRYVYSYPSQKAMASVKGKVKAITDQQITDRDPMVVILELNRITRGWANYFRTGASKRAFSDIDSYLWWRTWRWLRAKHRQQNARWIKRTYYHAHPWWPTASGYLLDHPSRVRIQRHAYRGNRIPTPWTA